MKQIFTLFITLITTGAFAQFCSAPVAQSVYQSNFNQMAVMRTDVAKLERANAFVKDNCVMAEQVKNIALLFQTDSMRMSFCKEAYSHTYDYQNFFVVYDAFAAFSYALRTYDYVSKVVVPKTTMPTGNATIAPRPATTPVYANWTYPDTARITASKGCKGPAVNETMFKPIGENVFKQPTDESKLIAIEQASAGNCLSMAQIMKLTSLITSEDLRLRVLKSTFPRVYDQEHYPFAAAAFASQPMKDQWMAFATNFLTPAPPPCVVSDADFKKLLADVQAKRFKEEKLSAITMMSKDRCFNVSQINTLALEFPFGEEKLQVMKMCYTKCPDQNNYYKLVDQLTFQSEKDDLTRFINSGGK